MKAALILSAIAGASAFAPASQSARTSALAVSADLQGVRGVGPETANAIVSGGFAVLPWMDRSSLGYAFCHLQILSFVVRCTV
jgi:hypothetical protein